MKSNRFIYQLIISVCMILFFVDTKAHNADCFQSKSDNHERKIKQNLLNNDYKQWVLPYILSPAPFQMGESITPFIIDYSQYEQQSKTSAPECYDNDDQGDEDEELFQQVIEEILNPGAKLSTQIEALLSAPSGSVEPIKQARQTAEEVFDADTQGSTSSATSDTSPATGSNDQEAGENSEPCQEQDSSGDKGISHDTADGHSPENETDFGQLPSLVINHIGELLSTQDLATLRMVNQNYRHSISRNKVPIRKALEYLKPFVQKFYGDNEALYRERLKPHPLRTIPGIPDRSKSKCDDLLYQTAYERIRSNRHLRTIHLHTIGKEYDPLETAQKLRADFPENALQPFVSVENQPVNEVLPAVSEQLPLNNSSQQLNKSSDQLHVDTISIAYTGPVLSIAALHNGLLITGHSKGELKVWDVNQPKRVRLVQTLKVHTEPDPDDPRSLSDLVDRSEKKSDLRQFLC